MDPAFGSNPSSYLSDVDLLGLTTGDAGTRRHLMLRRVRLRRDAKGEVVRGKTPAILADLPQGTALPESLEEIKSEANRLRELLTERDRQLAEWQTCHESVERELKRASDRASALQAKINATSNELAQARTELAKVRAEAEANRKANEALNRQLQGILKAHQGNPASIPAAARSAAKRKPGHKTSGELAA